MRATLSRSRKLQAWIAIGMVVMVVGFAVAGFGLYTGGADARATDMRICHRLNVLDDALLSILNRSLKGLPSNPYYANHPAQKEIALRNTEYAIRQLQRARCPS